MLYVREQLGKSRCMNSCPQASFSACFLLSLLLHAKDLGKVQSALLLLPSPWQSFVKQSAWHWGTAGGACRLSLAVLVGGDGGRKAWTVQAMNWLLDWLEVGNSAHLLLLCKMGTGGRIWGRQQLPLRSRDLPCRVCRGDKTHSW